jgi:hypothetical protein
MFPWYDNHRKFHESLSCHSLVIECVRTDITGEVFKLGWVMFVMRMRSALWVMASLSSRITTLTFCHLERVWEIKGMNLEYFPVAGHP